jgi:hypothetical protein
VQASGKAAVEGGELFGIGDEVDLVEHRDGWLVLGAELAEHFERGVVEAFDLRRGGVEHVDQEIREHRLLERGLEGFDQAVGQISDEADGVGDQQRLAVGQVDAAGGGVERGEQHVLGHDIGPAQGIEQRGFAGVGVADDGGVRRLVFLALLALGLALFADEFEFALAAVDAMLARRRSTSICFSPMPRAAPPPWPPPPEPPSRSRWPHIRASRGSAYCMRASSTCRRPPWCGRAWRKCRESPPRGRSRRGRRVFPLALLGWGEAVVDDDHVALMGAGEFADFRGLAGAAEEF